MKDFNLDKAFMAVKAQRYEEGQNAYEAALQKTPSVEAWTGLGITKLFQLLGNQTMEEVVYCFNQAREMKGADKKAIELQLISYSALVAEQATSYCVTLIDEMVQAEKDIANAVLVAGIAAGLATNSKSLSGSIVSGAIASAGAGVAIGKLGDIHDYKAAGQFLLNILANIQTNVTNYLIEVKASQEAIAFDNRIKQLQAIIAEASSKSKKAGAWYNTGWVWFWLLFIWPVGVYGLIMRYKK
tara:strand:- start:47 stop:772 length:726 start_codon:yes stop_codon:yes gene_type:complete